MLAREIVRVGQRKTIGLGCFVLTSATYWGRCSFYAHSGSVVVIF
jgi:hypothetical protein